MRSDRRSTTSRPPGDRAPTIVAGRAKERACGPRPKRVGGGREPGRTRRGQRSSETVRGAGSAPGATMKARTLRQPFPARFGRGKRYMILAALLAWLLRLLPAVARRVDRLRAGRGLRLAFAAGAAESANAREPSARDTAAAPGFLSRTRRHAPELVCRPSAPSRASLRPVRHRPRPGDGAERPAPGDWRPAEARSGHHIARRPQAPLTGS